MRTVLTCHKRDKNRVELVVRQSPASKGEEATALETVTRRQPLETQQTEKT
jgi:hypothetical protein